MRITILSPGSRGDVQPYVALGKGLKSAGFEVNIATHAYFERFVRSHGLDFSPLSGNPRDILSSEPGKNWLESNYRPLTFVKRMRIALEPVIGKIFEDSLKACEGSQAVLFGVITAFAGLTIAEKLGIRAIPAPKQHLHPTSTYPCGMVMPAISFGGLYNRITYPIGFQIYWQVLRPLINRWRQKLDMPPETVQGPIHVSLQQRPPCLYGFSEHVIPRAPEWGEEVSITGYWMLDEEDDWKPPENLVRFIENGPPPVYVGFGSMTAQSATKITKITLEALKCTGLRGVLLSGWGAIDLCNLPDTVFPLEFAPHEWLFPHMKAVVHHGGSGTTAIGLKSGKPSILVPFFADQPYWGWHVQRHNVGPKPIPSTRLTAKRLAKALDQTINTPEISERAAALGKKLKREDGVGNAVKAMKRIMQMA